MAGFELVFDVKADSAEAAIAAVDAMRTKTFGRTGTSPAEYAPAKAEPEDGGMWRVTQPVTSDHPSLIVFDAAAAAGDSNGQIAFVIPTSSSRQGGGGGQAASSAAVQEHVAELEKLQAELRASKEREAALLAERDAAKAQVAAAQAAAANSQSQAPATEPPITPAPVATTLPPPPPPSPTAPMQAPPPPPAPAAAPPPPPPAAAPPPPPPAAATPSVPPPPPSGPPPGSLLAPPPAAMAPVGHWKPTHLVSGRGLPAWDAPDPTKPASAKLPPWLEVQVLDQVGAWANVLCKNGWQGWVDSAQLVTRAG